MRKFGIQKHFFKTPTSAQSNLTKVWVLHENDFAHPPPPTQTQYQQYLSCYWPDFDQILNVGSWDLFEHIPTFKMTFVQATFVLATFVHIRNISAFTDLIVTKLQK